MNKIVFLFILGWISCINMKAQGTSDDYNRAFTLENRLKDKVFHSNVTPQWIGSTNRFWYINNTPQGKMYVLVDAQNKTRKPLFDQNKLALELGLSSDKPVEASKLPIQNLKVSNSLDTLHFVYNSYNWTFTTGKNTLKKGDKVKNHKDEYWGTVDTERTGNRKCHPTKKRRYF